MSLEAATELAYSLPPGEKIISSVGVARVYPVAPFTYDVEILDLDGHVVAYEAGVRWSTSVAFKLFDDLRDGRIGRPLGIAG